MRISEVAIVLKYLGNVYGQKITADQAKAYHTVLRDMPRLQLVDAATLWVGREKWFPKPTELLDASKRVDVYPLSPTTEAAQWYMFSHGYESSDDFTEADVVAIYAEAGVDMGIN